MAIKVAPGHPAGRRSSSANRARLPLQRFLTEDASRFGLTGGFVFGSNHDRDRLHELLVAAVAHPPHSFRSLVRDGEERLSDEGQTKGPAARLGDS